MMPQTTIQPAGESVSAGGLRLELNRQIANCVVLFMKLHNYHWFVKGHHFFTLHAKFEELYNEVQQHLDALAERLLTIGETPVADLRGCLELSTVREASGGETPEDMARTTAKDLRAVSAELKRAIEIAQRQGDEATADLLLGMVSSYEKHAWMLEAYVQK
jgi:starvation-inducible DNA-binding protein